MESIVTLANRFLEANRIFWTPIRGEYYLAYKDDTEKLYPMTFRRMEQKGDLKCTVSIVVKFAQQPDERMVLSAAAFLAFGEYEAVFCGDGTPVFLDGLSEMVDAFHQSGIDHEKLPLIVAMSNLVQSSRSNFYAVADDILNGNDGDDGDGEGEEWKRGD